MNSRIIVIVVAMLTLLAMAYFGYNLLSKLKPDTPQRSIPEVKRFVKVRQVHYSDVETHVEGLGRITSQQQFDLSVEVQGKLLNGAVALKKGQSFKEGDVLAKVYDTDVEMTLQSRKSKYLNSLANILADFKVDFPDRFQLWEGYFQAVNLDQPLPDLPEIASKQEKIYLASKNILSEYYGIKSDEIKLSKYTLIAPFSGSYTQVYLEVGSIVNPGSKIASLIRTDRLEVEVPLEQYNAHWVKLGDKVDLFAEDGAKIGTGKVVRKSNFVDPGTQSISVFVELAQKNGRPVFQGQYLKAVFPGMLITKAMEIPRNARFNNNEVFVVKDSLLKKESIEIVKVNENSLVFRGLNEGGSIVVEPLANAYENMVVGKLPVDGEMKKQNTPTAE